MRKDPAGMALPLVLLLLVVLTTFGHATLVLSHREVQASAAFRDLARAEKAARVGLHMAFSLSPDPLGDRSPWVAESLVSGELMDGLTYSAVRRWIDQEFFLLQATGGVKGWPGREEVGAVGWTLHPGTRLASFLAVAEVGSEIRKHEGSTFSTEGFFSLPEGWPPGVGGEIGSRAGGIFPEGPLPEVAEGATIEDASGLPGLGLLSGTALLRRSQPSANQAIGARGERAGCPGSGEPPVFVGSLGSLSLPGGWACGLVVTGGDLRVGPGTVFQGVILAAGNLVIEPDGKVEGMVRVGNDLVLKPGAEFFGASLPAVWALEGITRLHYPIPVLPGSFLRK